METLPIIWIVAGLLLMLLELVLPGGVAFLVGAGAALVGVLLLSGVIEGIMPALTSWFILSIVLLLSLRNVVTRFVPSTVSRSNTNEDIDAHGHLVHITETIPADGEGRIEYRGTSWKARSYHGDRTLEKGERVRLVVRQDLAWLVEPAPTDEEAPRQRP